MPDNKINFAKEVEKLINPITVGSLHFIQGFNKFLPKSVQKVFIKSSAKKMPFMGFVVEPYSSFLCYEIKDTKKANALMPKGFKLTKTSIFTDDEPKYYMIFGSFRAHTSAFWGVRNEVYIIAKNTKSGLLSWLIVDYDSNTIGYDKKYGLRSPNCEDAVFTINHRGRLFVDIKRKDKNQGLEYTADIEAGKMTPLNQRLWLEGNLSVGYGSELNGSSKDVFSLKFEPCEVEKALQLKNKDVDITSNNWYPKIIGDVPSQIVCFPYAQHFVSGSPGHSSVVKNKEELENSVESLDFAKIRQIPPNQFRNMFMIGSAVSFAVSVALIVALLLK
ncbi:MAG: hypothetical protein PVI21_01670 [Candidatus Woesebacteria bacterium]|jgi:hypothetical protein